MYIYIYVYTWKQGLFNGFIQITIIDLHSGCDFDTRSCSFWEFS